MAFYFDENCRNQLKWTETSFGQFWTQTAFGPIVFGPFEYSAQTAKIHYLAQNVSALSNSKKGAPPKNLSLFEFSQKIEIKCLPLFIFQSVQIVEGLVISPEIMPSPCERMTKNVQNLEVNFFPKIYLNIY
jgi:hypothetical protein